MEILLIICILFLLLSLQLFNKDIFHPTFLYFTGFTVSAILATYNSLAWKVEMSFETQMCFFLAWISFFIGSITSRLFIKGKMNKISYDISFIKIDSVVVWIVIIFNALITFLLYKTLSGSVGTISSQISSGVSAIAYAVKEGEVEIGGANTQLVKVSKGTAYVFAFILANNIALSGKNVKKIIKDNFVYTIPIFFYLLQCYLKGSRFTMLGLFIAFAFYYYFTIQKISGWKYKANIKIIIRIIISIIAIMFLFWAVKGLVGRTSELGFIDYISQYIGGPYPLLNSYIKNPIDRGLETFAGLATSFNKMGLTNFQILGYHEFRFSDSGVILGNAYSAIRNYYHDFGFIGVIIINFFVSFVFSYQYRKFRIKNSGNNYFGFVLYGCLLYTIVFQFFSDYLLARLSIGFFIEIIIMYIIYHLLVKKKYRVK